MSNGAASWTCPRCDRDFARANQGHDCIPGITVDALFAPRPRWQREVYDAIVAHVRTVGPVHEDAVQVGVFLKVPKRFAEVRPKQRWVSLLLSLPREVRDGRVVRVVGRSRRGVWHELQLRSVAEVDGTVRDWLREGYVAAEDG